MTASTRTAELPRFAAEPEAAALHTAWQRDGVLVLDGFASGEDCAALRRRASELIDACDPETEGCVFSTTTQAHAAEEYFGTSGDKVRLFWEAEAVDGAGRLSRPKHLAVNKIGHALHDLDPVFDRFSRQPRLAALAKLLGLAQPLLLQSMLICKPPGIGGEVVWHQDGTFLRTEPEGVLGFWFALEPATVANGCLWVLPGAHRGPLAAWFGRTPEGLRTRRLAEPGWDLAQAVPVETEAGTLVVLHGRLPHFSRPNRSDRPRMAYSLHLIDGTARYLPDNWLQRAPDMPLRGFGPD